MKDRASIRCQSTSGPQGALKAGVAAMPLFLTKIGRVVGTGWLAVALTIFLASGADAKGHKGHRITGDEIGSAVQSSLARRIDSVPLKLSNSLKHTALMLRRISRETRTGNLVAEQHLLQLDRSIASIEALRGKVLAHASSRPGGMGAGYVAKVGERFAELLDALRAVRSAKNATVQKQAVSDARKLLRRLIARKGRHDKKTKSAPFNIPRPERHTPPVRDSRPTTRSEPPRYREDDSPSASPPRHASAPTTRPVMYASLDGFIMADTAPPTPTEASTCEYVDADLGVGEVNPEVAITDEIAALAKSLKYSPVRILEYVSNEIEFEPYFGSLKGAQGVLISGSGNATDTASLTIALLRASGIPARYVKGKVKFFAGDDRLNRWVGAKSAQGAAAMLATGDIPTSRSGDNVAFTHVWVEACIPYQNYRGSGGDNFGHRWVPMDPSFKSKDYQDGIVVDLDFDYQSYLATRTLLLPHEEYEQQVEQHIKTLPPRYSNNTLADVPYSGHLVPRKVDILPATLPYEVIEYLAWDGSTKSETAALPAKHRYTLHIDVGNVDTGDELGAAVLEMPEIALSRLTLAFQAGTGGSLSPALTAYRQSLNAQYGAGAATYIQNNGGIDCRWDYVPVLKVEGQSHDMSPTPEPSCYFWLNEWYGGPPDTQLVLVERLPKRTLDLDVHLGDESVNKVSYNNISAFNYHALQVYSFQASDRLIEQRAAKLLDNIKSTADPEANKESTLGEFLHLVGLKYMHYIADAYSRVGRIYGESGRSGNHLGLTSSRSEVSYLFDLPYAVTNTGFLIDVPGGLSRSTNLDTGATSFEGFVLAGYALSAFESYVWQENARMDAVSSVRGIQYANENNIEVIDINSANKATELPKLQVGDGDLEYSESTRNTIEGLVNDGFDVKIPVRLIDYAEWTGQVYIATKKSSNGRLQASYIIGPYAGGYTTSSQPAGSGYQIPPQIYQEALQYADRASPVVNSANNFGNNNYITKTGDPVNMVTGNMYHVESDLSLPGRGGLPIVFQRTYNSMAASEPGASSGPLGYGWTHSFNHFLTFEDTDSDPDEEASDEDGLTSSVTWHTGDGGQRFIAVNGDASGVSIGETFTTPEGFYFVATHASDGRYRIREKNGLTYYFENVPGQVGNRARLVRIEDRNGNRLSFDYTSGNLDSVTDDMGRAVTMVYDGSGRITHVRDWTYETTGREWRYSYNPDGELEYVDDPLAVSEGRPGVHYEYYGPADGENLDHAMRRYEMPRGNGMTFEYYQNGRVFRHTDDAGGSMTLTYNEYRRESTSTNERGYTHHYFFDENGNPTLSINENGERTEYTYDPANPFNRIEQRDPAGLVTQYEYDDNGKVTLIRKPSGHTIEYSHFNEYGRPGKTKDANGNYTLTRFDTEGNVTDVIVLKSGYGQSIDPAIWNPVPEQILSWTVSTYDAYGNPGVVRRVRDFSDPTKGPTAELGYVDAVNGTEGLSPVTVRRCGDRDGDGIIDRPTECDEANQAFDALGRMTSGSNADWYPVEYTYDVVGRVTSGTDEVGQVHDFGYDKNGNAVSERLAVTTQAGVTEVVDQAQNRYDVLDRLVESIDAGGFVSRNEYDPVGNLVRVTDPDGYSLSFEYDALNRAVKAFDQEGHAVTRSYDGIGRVRSVADPNGSVVEHTYYGPEGGGRLKRRTDPAGRFVEFEYDGAGRVTRVVDQLGRETLSQYDAAGRVLRVVGPVHDDPSLLEPIRQVTRYTYDELGYLRQVAAGYTTDTAGIDDASDVVAVQQTNTYDDFGRKLTETDPNGGTWTFEYDIHNNLTKVTDAKGQEIVGEFGYGGVLRERRAYVTAGDPTPHVTTYTRNALGQVVRVEAPEVTYSYRYDAAHRMVRAQDHRAGKGVEYEYSPGGLLNLMRDDEGNITRSLYDPVGRLAGIWAPNGALASFSYDAGGRLTERWFENGVGARYAYNPDDTLKSLLNRRSDGSTISRHDYTYDAAGNRDTYIENINGAVRERRYVYDLLDRLSEVRDNATDTALVSYTYDKYNNRVTETDAGAVRAYVYDAAQQLLSIRTGTGDGPVEVAFDYDPNGNLITKTAAAASLQLTYDALDRLVTASLDGAAPESYTYDPQGRRIAKRVGEEVEHFLYSGSAIAAEYGASWSKARAVYTYGPGIDKPLIYMPDSGQPEYYHSDGLGSVVAMTDATGTSLATAQYDAWGQIVAGSGDLRRFGYTSREADATGLIYYRARYYDPEIGRFTQRDPKGFIDGINRYVYATNNPTNFVDPWGTNTNGFSGSQPHLVPQQGITDSLYVSGPIPVARYDLGIASLTVNGALNLINSGGNLLMRGLATLGEPLDRYAGEINSVATGFGPGGIAAGGTLRAAGWLSRMVRVETRINRAAQMGVDLQLRYKDGWTAAQRAAADAKCLALCEADTVVTRVQRSGTSAASRYRRAGNEIPSGSDVDHVHDLQLNGKDVISNMSPLDFSVNRSLGAQIQNQIKNLTPGTVINNVYIH